MVMRRFPLPLTAWRVAGIGLLACFVTACSSGPTVTNIEPDKQHILRVASIYNSYKSDHSGRPPKDIQELKTWAKGLKPEKLRALGIEDVETALVSPRDKQPYVLIKPEAAMSGGGHGGPPPAIVVCVYEKDGVNGKRLTAGLSGNASELDEATLKRYVPGL